MGLTFITFVFRFQCEICVNLVEQEEIEHLEDSMEEKVWDQKSGDQAESLLDPILLGLYAFCPPRRRRRRRRRRRSENRRPENRRRPNRRRRRRRLVPVFFRGKTE